jgi:hypothetical protein
MPCIDTFAGASGTLLSAHTPDDGGAWTNRALAGFAGSAALDDAGRLRSNFDAAWCYLHSHAPASNHQRATFDLIGRATGGFGNNLGVVFRASSTAETYYLFRCNVASGATTYTYDCFRFVAGTPVLLAQVIIPAFTGTKAIVADVIDSGGNAILTLTEDGVSRINFTDTAPITAVGKVGVFGGVATADGVGLAMDNLVSGTPGALAAGAASTTSTASSSATVTATDASGGTTPIAYQWYRSTASGTLGTAVSGATSRNLTDTGLSPSTAYYYTLRYTDAAAASVESNQIVATTSAPVVTGVTIPVNDPNWYRVPLGYRINGSVSAIANTEGNESVLVVGPTTTGQLRVNTAGLSTTGKVRIAYSVDGGPYTIVDLTSSTTVVNMLVGGALGTHTFRWKSIAIEGGTIDRWATPAMALVETSFGADTGAASIAYTPHTDKLMLVYGDSLMESARMNDTTDTVTSMNASLHMPNGLAEAFNAAVAIRAIGGGGWYLPGSGGTPPLFRVGDDVNSMWNKYSAGQSMLVGGLYSTQPDYIVVAHGYNDGTQTDANVRASVAGWLAAVRAAAPNAYIIVLLPYSRVKASAIISGFGDYTASTSSALSDMTVYKGTTDTKAFMIDLGADFALRLNQFPTPSDKAPDGLHAGQRTNVLATGRVTRALQFALGGSSVSATVPVVAAIRSGGTAILSTGAAVPLLG